MIGARRLTHLKQFCALWYERWQRGDRNLLDAGRRGRPLLAAELTNEQIANFLVATYVDDGVERPFCSVEEVGSRQA